MAGLRKRQRIQLIMFGAAALVLSAVLVGLAFKDSIVFFVAPTELVAKAQAGEAPPNQRLRLGGLVEEGSIVRGQEEAIRFQVTDNETTVAVVYEGGLPDQLREGQGVVAGGYRRDENLETEK
ncbi:MAG: cytochrome c maturation protein CcmE, partial [Pseudomonadota bacterium]